MTNYFDRPHRNQSSGVGVLVANLGTPSAPTSGAVRKYLREFLSDRRIVDAPRLTWWFILNLFILPFRPARSAALYRKIWTPNGSPLLISTERIGRDLGSELASRLGTPTPVEIGMRYGEPTLEQGLKQLVTDGCNKVLLLPLYPQYSETTTESTFDAIGKAIGRFENPPELETIEEYCEHPSYIEAMAVRIESAWKDSPFPGKLLMSFHGLPQRYADAGDPYPEHCHRTAKALAARLCLEDASWLLTYQSRFGREPWLEPATDATLTALGADGHNGIDVVCPGFAVDCLETLEEIAITGREQFENAGGTGFRYIPALNDSRRHICALADIVAEKLRA